MLRLPDKIRPIGQTEGVDDGAKANGGFTDRTDVNPALTTHQILRCA